MSAINEEEFIARYFRPLTEGADDAYGLRDDCATLRPLNGHEFVLKTDPIREAVHFFPDDAPQDIAWKALAVNTSDIAAKAARPVAYLLATSFPAPPAPDWMAAFCQGLKEAQDAFGCRLLGGDTDVGPAEIAISVTMIGEVKISQMVRREGALPGDRIIVSGELGLSALGLKLREDPTRLSSWQLTQQEADAARQRYWRPAPRLGLRTALATHARAAMDISDGLIKDLSRMCNSSRVGAVLRYEALPRALALAKIHRDIPTIADALISAGDDYEILAVVPPDQATDYMALAAKGGVQVTEIGEITHALGIEMRDSGGKPITLPSTGYDHFAKPV